MAEKNLILSPSLLSCDFTRAGEQMTALEQSGIRWFHLDVMDGLFVPNISFGQPVIRSLRKSSRAVFDTHLMICNPLRYVADFAKAGADILTVHLEATEQADNTAETLRTIRKAGMIPGLSVKPSTPAEAAFPYLDQCGLILIMTVEPGFGGQSFMAEMLPKIAAFRAEIDRRGLSISLEVDGGIDSATITDAVSAGADTFVAGSAVFGKDDPVAAAAELLSRARLQP